MTASDTQTLVTGAITTFGTSALAVLTAIIGLAVAFLVFRWGWKKIRGVAH